MVAGGGIKYDKNAFDDIIKNNNDDIKRLEELQSRLNSDIAIIQANWTDDQERIDERDKDFNEIKDRVDIINRNFKDINSMLNAKNESFFNTRY